jgi:hypothetical protein
MNALKPRPSFQVLIMSEESRLGREQIEVAYALKQLARLDGQGSAMKTFAHRPSEILTVRFVEAPGW